MKKRGMELTISTLVVIILALLMLVMGTILVKKTYCAAITGVDSIDDITQQVILQLYTEQENNVVVKELINEISKEVYYGVGFVIKNENKISNTEFEYSVDVFDLQDCSITESKARDYIVTGKSSTANIAPGNTYTGIIEFNIPRDAPVCSLKYKIDVTNNNEFYDSTEFTVRIKDTGWATSAVC